MIFYGNSAITIGRGNFLFACGFSIRENTVFYGRYASRGVRLIECKAPVLKNKTIPRILVPWDEKQILQEDKVIEAPNEYLHFLSWIVKKEYFLLEEEKLPSSDFDAGILRLDRDIKYRISQLLSREKFVDVRGLADESDESGSLTRIQGFEKVHALMRKFDLGRRSYLKFTPTQTREALEKDLVERTKKNPAFKGKDLSYEERLDLLEDIKYNQGEKEIISPVISTEDEVPVFKDRPWLKTTVDTDQ